MKRVILIFVIVVLSVVSCGKKSHEKTMTDESSVVKMSGDRVDSVRFRGIYVDDNYSDAQNEENGFANQQNIDIEDEKENSSDGTDYDDDWEGVTCKGYDLDDNNIEIQIQECIFPNANLQQVYDIVKSVDVNLMATELPLKNIEYPLSNNEPITVRYEYKSRKHLFIKIGYNGGPTYFEIIENEDNTVSKITLNHY